ncbi:MAG: HEPN domain-containing protein [Terriglobia bacterium]
MERGKNKLEWQKLSISRLQDAEVLFGNQRYAAAYYLAGYAVECALKARIASLTREGDFPPKPQYVRGDLYTHRLVRLVRLVRLLEAAELASMFE